MSRSEHCDGGVGMLMERGEVWGRSCMARGLHIVGCCGELRIDIGDSGLGSVDVDSFAAGESWQVLVCS